MNTRKVTGDMADQVEKDRDELVALRAKCERLEGELSGITGQLKQSESQCAEMRSALEWVQTFQGLFEGNRNTLKLTLDKALSTDCGKAIMSQLDEIKSEYSKLQQTVSHQGIEIIGQLERLEEARRLLASVGISTSTGHVLLGYPEVKDWWMRRDAWLKGQL